MDMAWGNVVLTENKNDVEVCLAEQAYEEDIPTRGTAESTSSALFSNVASRGRQAMEGKTANDSFEGIVGASRSLREVLDLVRTVAPTESTPLIDAAAGTRNELIARAILNITPSHRDPFFN